MYMPNPYIIVISCVTTETVMVSSPSIFYKADEVHLFRYIRDPGTPSAKLYEDHFQSVCIVPETRKKFDTRPGTFFEAPTSYKNLGSYRNSRPTSSSGFYRGFRKMACREFRLDRIRVVFCTSLAKAIFR